MIFFSILMYNFVDFKFVGTCILCSAVELHDLCVVNRCYLKLGEWQQSLEGLNQHTVEQILGYFRQATEHDRDWYKVSVSLL